MSATATDTDLIEIAECLAAADKRLRALEANPSARHSDINRMEAQIATMRKELDFATVRVGEAGKREFAAKAEANAESYRTDLARLRTELEANIRGINPRGEWERGMVLNRNDVVTVNGTSYVCLRDGVRDKPNYKDKATFQVLARRGGAGGFNGGAAGYVSPPSGATAQGQIGEFSYDAQYYYICVAVNTWLRTSIATW